MNDVENHPYIFGVDLDGVCADFYEGIRPIAAEWMGVEEKLLVRNVSYGLPEWGIPEAPGAYLDFHKFAVTQRQLFSRLEVMPGCPQVLRKLSKEKVRIRIITHRLFIKYFHKQAVSQTIDWLETHGIPYWDLCFMQHKTDVGAHIYIEDSEKNIKEYERAGKKVIIFSNSTNMHIEGLRVHKWEDVYQIVMDDYIHHQSSGS